MEQCQCPCGAGGSEVVGARVGSNMRLLLSNCLALELSRPRAAAGDGCVPTDLWMYDAGYLLFQSFLASNAKCWWVDELPQATTELQFAGYVAPGVLLLQGTDRALQTVRNAYAKNVLKPPPTYFICGLGEVEGWWSRTAPRGHFTPLPEALCHVIMDLTEQGQAATQDSVRARLASHFPSMSAPAPAALYDALAQLQRDGRAYRTNRGFFVATPERRRATANANANAPAPAVPSAAPLLLSDKEALLSLYGEMHTERDGDVTHQCVQTNLADVICGGNPNDKVLYGRPNKRRSASCSPRSLDRRNSLRTLGGLLSSKRSLHRCSSTRSLSRTSKSSFKIYSDSGSSTDYPASTDSSPKKTSLLSRLFRRSRSKTDARDLDNTHDSCHSGELKSFSAQFPPSEWFNQRAIHLHCVATQTQPLTAPEQRSVSGVSPCMSYVSLGGASDGAGSGSLRSTSLTRRHRRHLSSDDTHPLPSVPSYTGSLPRSHNKPTKNGSIKRIDYPLSYSGPSSLESKKSFPSSGHSSLDSQDYGDLSGKRSHADLVRAQSLVKVYSLQNSPKSPHRLKSKPPIGENPSKNLQKSISNGSKPLTTKHGLMNTTKALPSMNGSKPSKDVVDINSSKQSSPDISMPVSLNTSNSNNSITLKVTTNTTTQNGGGTNTKVYVQNSNSPMKSIITFENGNKNPSSNNVYIINGERSQNQQSQKNVIETSFENNASVKKENVEEKSLKNNENSPKINKNEANLNNNRKMYLQMGNNSTTNGLIFKNQLKSDNFDYKDNTNSLIMSPTKSFENISFENFKYYEKNSPKSQKNSCSDIKNMDLLKKPTKDLEAIKNNTIQEKSDKRCKSEISLGSEPNLVENNADNATEYLKTIGKKRLSLRTDSKNEEASYDFPSLSDLSYNFTSLTAQKILKGVSLNSVDTLVELNMVEKQNNCDFNNDLGVV